MTYPIPPAISEILSELVFSATTGGGPGGQHVNKVSTKVTLRWSIQESAIISDEQKAILLSKLANKLTKEGELLLSSHESRSQLKNKEEVIRKLSSLIQQAFERKKARKTTKPGKAAVQRRIDAKKKLSEKKKWRRE
ncbi:alternative ribosome rescue aminoacyl-tRNA hydrolase ArfB [uncultured Imperialibacter sp.]|uniref:alternative ribosome rescue aminoacyl-tRNA hydrolase ArfB n=1 Tax=uncultured Imperialibacter sp. TaxID=1672639 RepID=UPI0030DD97FB|tara:strand:- start:83 stop:493 length:411 start_codon:yes stop_codon:yes gene_type:complete